MRVIVGLGNPGAEYAGTRHNIGWMVLDALASELSAGRFRRERAVEVAEARAGNEKVYLLKPQSFMNCSGQALAGWLGTYREIRDALREAGDFPEEPAAGGASLSREDKADDALCDWPGLLVATDDVNLPLGRMRFRPSGSAGGHNGLKDIEKALGGRGYPRLRLGVGEPPGRMDRVDYVLGRFAPDERDVVGKVTAVAAEAARDWLLRGMDWARGKYNGLRLGGGAP